MVKEPFLKNQALLEFIIFLIRQLKDQLDTNLGTAKQKKHG